MSARNLHEPYRSLMDVIEPYNPEKPYKSQAVCTCFPAATELGFCNASAGGLRRGARWSSAPRPNWFVSRV